HIPPPLSPLLSLLSISLPPSSLSLSLLSLSSSLFLVRHLPSEIQLRAFSPRVKTRERETDSCSISPKGWFVCVCLCVYVCVCLVKFSISYHRSEEHTSELQSHLNLVCPLL